MGGNSAPFQLPLSSLTKENPGWEDAMSTIKIKSLIHALFYFNVETIIILNVTKSHFLHFTKE